MFELTKQGSVINFAMVLLLVDFPGAVIVKARPVTMEHSQLNKVLNRLLLLFWAFLIALLLILTRNVMVYKCRVA